MASRGHPYTEFFFPTVMWNPYLPVIPGAPGLFFFTRTRDWPEELPLFVDVAPTKWLYLGNYKGIPVEPLTPEEWMRQAPEVSLLLH